ncbi:MAG TPA: ADP-ribosylglycohydrolase family protein [Chloroflexota bacterium]|nr:ADP-ribosylglycohydrolase family protein [Chloroflexota bacterium]
MLAWRERILGGLWGAIVGDALGVPVESVSRAVLRARPVHDLQALGPYPPGTWSDDSALLLCTVESLLGGFDLEDLGRRFVRWYEAGYWAPWPGARAFGIGATTRRAILNLARGVPAAQAGPADEASCGNGSLMRILPIALYCASQPADSLLDHAHRASAVTHRHPRAQLACGFYCALAVALGRGEAPDTAYRTAIAQTLPYYQQPPYAAERVHFARLFAGTLADCSEEDIRSDGYVVHTLEASVWCLLRARSFTEAVLRAVNLGEDADTTGAVTGGLAGLHWGVSAIPPDWRNQLARRDAIARLLEAFAARLPPPR